MNMDQKSCWECKKELTINDFGYSLCRCGKVTMGDRSNYLILGDPFKDSKYGKYQRNYYYEVTKPKRQLRSHSQL